MLLFSKSVLLPCSDLRNRTVMHRPIKIQFKSLSYNSVHFGKHVLVCESETVLSIVIMSPQPNDDLFYKFKALYFNEAVL